MREFLTAFERTRPTPCRLYPSVRPELINNDPFSSISSPVPGLCVSVSPRTSSLYREIFCDNSYSFDELLSKDHTFHVPTFILFLIKLEGVVLPITRSTWVICCELITL